MSHPALIAWIGLFAQQAGGAAGGGKPQGFFEAMGPMLPAFLMIGVLFFFMILRPQKREQQAREQMLSAIKKNDRVLTSGGMFGVVTSVQAEQNEVTLRIDEKNDTKIRMQLSSIARVLAGDDVDGAKTDKTEATK